MLDLIINLICAFWATYSFCVMFSIAKKCYFLGSLNGLFAWACYYLLHEPTSPAIASFFAGVVITFFARIFAGLKKYPATEFLIPGIIPLVPGAGLHYTAYYFVMNDMDMFAMKGTESLKVAFAVAIGMVLILSLPGEWFFWKKDKGTDSIQN